MSDKVKRGLGLLVVAAIGYLVVFAVRGDDGMASPGGPAAIIEAIGYLMAAVGLIGGLLLLAWGLLRE